ncbi:hypothetical protein OGR47_01205 [Methylocystis sp. MJC1]|jgi:hypothetical protein|uniref:hypothetical protein n=1 Tax=Methylocystis sp. MJC1 TaxID=2654282 RepID=UPI0013EB25BC|nr:hypothetical protein [Methylocystis sp. MJC1]KAF2989656.1 hypothetical protein MJC1_03208 [Methylocystis sp. MJC1]MBU6525636.1 hypothetical protein [Methylocystis sp. MJC1]UZX12110.1 hypothetical protein OGR47_01205 [Methylocystis sp. MJC1]
MRQRLLASLIVCVALLTQLGASLWGAAAAREGYAGCHRQAAIVAATDARGGRGAPFGAPTPHDHASCSLCQLGLTAIDSDAPSLPARRLEPYWRIEAAESAASPLGKIFNRNAPARASPARV